MAKLPPGILLVVWFGIMPRVMASPDSPAVPAKPSLETIREAQVVRNGLFQNVSFRVVYQGRSQAIRGGPWKERVQAIDGVFDANQRVRIDLMDSPPDPARAAADPGKQAHAVMTVSPEEFRMLETVTDGKQHKLIGVVHKDSQVPWLNHPLNLVGLGEFGPLRYLGDPNRAAVEGVETLRGEEVVRVGNHWSVPDYPGKKFSMIFWFNPSKGYALERSESLYQPAENLPPKLMERIDRMDFSAYPAFRGDLR